MRSADETDPVYRAVAFMRNAPGQAARNGRNGARHRTQYGPHPADGRRAAKRRNPAWLAAGCSAAAKMRVGPRARGSLLLLAATLISACGSGGGASDLPVSPEGNVLVTEIRFGDYLVLTNTRDTPVDLAGHWLCNGPAYLELAGELDAGESVRISAEPLNGLGAVAGELGLFRTREFTAPEAIVDYVTWGTGTERAAVAVQAGIWPAGAAVDVAGPGIVRTTVAPSPDAWMATE